MDTDQGPFTRIEADRVGRESWRLLLMTAMCMSLVNIFFCLYIRGSQASTFVSHAMFITLAGCAQAFLFGARFFSIEHYKLRAATERRTAQIFGVNFRENFRFLSTTGALTSTLSLLKKALVVIAFMIAVHYRAELSLSGLVFVVGLMVAFAFLPEWLWASVLTSAAFMIVETQINRGTQNIASLAAICLGGIEFLVFSWILAHSLDRTRFSSNKRRQDAPIARVANLGAAFIAIATLIFALAPKEQKKPEPMHQPRQTEVSKHTGRSGGKQAHGSGESAHAKGAQPLDPKKLASADNQQRDGSAQTKEADADVDLGSDAGEAESINAADQPGQKQSGAAKHGVVKGSVNTKQQEAGGKPNQGHQGTGSGGTMPHGTGAGGEKKEIAGTQEGMKKQEGIKKTAKKSSEIVPKKKPERQRFNLRPIIVVVVSLLAIGFIVLLAKMFKKKKRQETSKDRHSRKDLPDPVTAGHMLEADIRQALATAIDSDDGRRQIIIELYNILMIHYDRCGLARPEHFTPDDFSRSESIWRPLTRNPLSFVTSVFNRTYYGKKTPDQQAVSSYQQAVFQIGRSILRSAK